MKSGVSVDVLVQATKMLATDWFIEWMIDWLIGELKFNVPLDSFLSS